MIVEFLIGLLDGIAEGWLEYSATRTRRSKGRKPRK
ncbi:hypothetical protein SEA_VRESIDENCE_53 [Arthrobacter phage VResidence]|uniref:Uncharacterized protein n=1 Tax=Arthrobacter phage VResidence TaxID=2927294 RepID=A0A9X9P6W4_9CAUD|nr:hypothetical protein SEA_VRESIDENCE_53 [Arthrobacter phage VResidence]